MGTRDTFHLCRGKNSFVRGSCPARLKAALQSGAMHSTQEPLARKGSQQEKDPAAPCVPLGLAPLLPLRRRGGEHRGRLSRGTVSRVLGRLGRAHSHSSLAGFCSAQSFLPVSEGPME